MAISAFYLLLPDFGHVTGKQEPPAPVMPLSETIESSTN
jgi:hypothetical protein